MKNKSNFDLAQDCRESDKLPIDNLATYLLLNIPEFMNDRYLRIKQFPGGSSNLTYRLSNNQDTLILRRPPTGTKAKSAHDMVREHDVLQKLANYYSLSPRPVLLCDDKTIIGDKFFIMQEIKGLGIAKKLPVEMNQRQQHQLCENFVDGLVALHEIDIEHSELASLGNPSGYVERQLEGWQKRYQKAKTEDVLSSDKIYQWLTANLPLNSGYQALVHNDYKFDNFVLDAEKPEKIIGVLDWEMTTLGDPLLDLGCSLAYWVEANDPETMQAIRMMPTHLSGMMTRQEIFNGYCNKRNIIGVALTPYYVFGLFRLAVIAQQIYYRYYHGQTDNPKFKNFGQLVNILIGYAEQQIK